MVQVLIVAADLSALFTSGLLWLALQCSLLPLERLSRQLASMTSECLAAQRLSVELDQQGGSCQLWCAC